MRKNDGSQDAGTANVHAIASKLNGGECAAVKRQIVVWTSIGLVAVAASILLVARMHRWSTGAMRIKGAVIRRDDDPRRELPISDVVVTATDGKTTASTESNASGYFNLPFQGGVWPGQKITLSFRHREYEPMDMKLSSGLQWIAGRIYVAKLEPLSAPAAAKPNQPLAAVTNIRIRYTTNSESKINIGTAVKTFQVNNIGNVSCEHHPPCSPDGKWKASTGSESLDAGPGNEFGNVRASCIAGPCPFTRIDPSGFMNGGRNITVSVLDWSDTTTFLVEAEVFHTAIVSNVRESYPVIFGRALNFSVPPSQEGVSIEADLDKMPMVFPLGPELYLSWATCTARADVEGDKSTAYRCELKPGYRF